MNQRSGIDATQEEQAQSNTGKKLGEQPAPKPRYIGTIGHIDHGVSGLAMAMLASGLMGRMQRLDVESEAAIFDDLESLYIADGERQNEV